MYTIKDYDHLGNVVADRTSIVTRASINLGALADKGQADTCGLEVNLDAGGVDPIRVKRVWQMVELATGGAGTVLFRGRLQLWDTGRGTRVFGDATAPDLVLADCNIDLHGIIAGPVHRPAETDVVRMRWLGKTFLSGAPRRTTKVNYTAYVPNTHTKNMPARTYPAKTDPWDIADDCARASGKQYFLTPTHLFYDLPDSTALAAGLSIDDRPANINDTTVFSPDFGGPSANAARYDGTELLTGGGIGYGTNKIVKSHIATRVTNFDWWERVVDDLGAVTKAHAQSRLTSLLGKTVAARPTFPCTITLRENQVNLIAQGQTLSFRAAAAGITTPLIARVAKIAWEPFSPGWYRCHLEIGLTKKKAPQELVNHGGAIVATQGATIPFKPPVGVFSHVQTTSTANGSLDMTVGFATVTEGNLLILRLLVTQTAALSPILALPDDWSIDYFDSEYSFSPPSPGRLAGIWICSHVITAAEAAAAYSLVPTIDLGAGPTNLAGFSLLDEYTCPTDYLVADTGSAYYVPAAASMATPSLTPTDGQPYLVAIAFGRQPDYVLSAPGGGWVQNHEYQTVGGTRQAIASEDLIGAVAAGPYTGNAGSTGAGDGEALLTGVAYSAFAPPPTTGQPLGSSRVGTTNGSTTQFLTPFDYQPGSLHVYVGGQLIPGIVETDPTSGKFDLPASIAATTGYPVDVIFTADTGAVIATLVPTPAGNVIAPYPALGTGGDGSGEHVLGDDGKWKSKALFIGPPGFQGEPGDEGPPGPPGNQGPTGSGGVGPQGPAGIGLTGQDGEDAIDWPIGIQGPQGPVGQQGPQGPSVGIAGADGDDAYDWPIPGSQGVTGSVGPQGPAGVGLPGQDGEDAFDWPLPGSQGATGSVGPQGPAGTGTPGLDGEDAFDWPIPGSQGIVGPQGVVGPQGPSGIGLPGIDGDDAFDWPVPGSQGIQGPVGSQGPQGPSLGIPGIDGDDAIDWPIPGPAGVTGQTGGTGPQGPTGMGVPGQDGDDAFDWHIPGQQGAVGQTGPPGAQGPAIGVLAIDGEDAFDWHVPGATGAPGASGVAGAAGPPGIPGQDGDEAGLLWPTYGPVRQISNDVAEASEYLARLKKAADTQYRVSIGLNASSVASFMFGDGANPLDVWLGRASAGRMYLNTNGTAIPTLLLIESTSGQVSALQVRVSGDTTERAKVEGDATAAGLFLGPGNAALDWQLTRSAANAAALGSGDTLDLNAGKVRLPIGSVALTATEGYAQWNNGRRFFAVYDSVQERPVTPIGWWPFADAYGYFETSTVVSGFTAPAVGGSWAAPIHLTAPMIVQSVTWRNFDTATARSWEFRLYEDERNNSATIDEVVGVNCSESFTPGGAASNRTVNITTPGTILPPGVYWAVIRNTHATSTLAIGGVAAGTLLLNASQTKTVAGALGAALDMVTSWTKVTSLLAVRLNGRVMGQATAF